MVLCLFCHSSVIVVFAKMVLCSGISEMWTALLQTEGLLLTTS